MSPSCRCFSSAAQEASTCYVSLGRVALLSLLLSPLVKSDGVALLPLPSWSAPQPDAKLPLSGYSPLPRSNTTHRALFYGSVEGGAYNHAPMIGVHVPSHTIFVSWKNGVGASGEDEAGQHVLFVTSTDGSTWSPPAVLFPPLSPPAVALFAGPFASLNGRLYASASPGLVGAGDAQGAQFCLWPDGLDPRNAGPPGEPQQDGVLLMRRVDSSPPGPTFWVSHTVPAAYAEASKASHILTLSDMDAETLADVATLHDVDVPPCDDASTGARKCEACARGCQLWDKLPRNESISNERTHWNLPNGGGDVLLYRVQRESIAYAARRASGGSQAAWEGGIRATTIPNDSSNMNAGTLPDGRAFLVHNPTPHHMRDPLTIAIAADALTFSVVRVVQTCTNFAPLNSTCCARVSGACIGPSYPQVLVLGPPMPHDMQGLYVVAANNKEDIILSRYALRDLA